MPSLADQLTQDLAAAMRSGDTRRRDVIRFLRSAIKNAEIERQRPLTDAEIQDVIRAQIKQRRDAIEMFRSGGREDLADEEEAQIALLTPYLPPQLTDEELQVIIDATIDRLGAATPRDTGRVIQAVLAEAAGRAEGRRVSQRVKEALTRSAARGER